MADSSFLERKDWNDLSPAARQILQPRYERLGYLGEFFAVLAHDEKLLISFLQLSDAMRDSLALRDREVLALTISAARKAEYELFQHEQLCLKSGLTAEWVAAVESLDPASGELSDDDRDVMQLAVAVEAQQWEQGRIHLARIAQRRGTKAAVDLLVAAGYYLMAVSLEQALDLRSPVPSIFEPGRM